MRSYNEHISITTFLEELGRFRDYQKKKEDSEAFTFFLQYLDIHDPELKKRMIINPHENFTKINIAKEKDLYEVNLIGLKHGQATPAHHHNSMHYRLETVVQNKGVSLLYKKERVNGGRATIQLKTKKLLSPGVVIKLPGRTIHQMAHPDYNNLPLWIMTFYVPDDKQSTHYIFENPLKITSGGEVETIKKDIWSHS